LREQLDDGAWQGARVTRAQIIVHAIFTNTIHARHMAQLYFCAETHEVARRATSSLSSSMNYSARLLGGRPRARPWRTRPLLRGRPLCPRGPRPWLLKTRQSDRWRCARTPRGGHGFCHQGGPGRTRRPQGGSSHDGLARGVHMLLAQKSRAQVRGRNALDDDGACLLRKGIPDLLGDLGARKAESRNGEYKLD
jgi:hypothetical protein